jgi:hypothetical protein
MAGSDEPHDVKDLAMADANVSVSFSASTNDFVSQVGEAKDALQTFAAPFGEINRQLVSFGTAASQAFSADHLTPYRDALSATQSLQQSFAADSARAAAALREGDDAAYAEAARAAQLATSEELRILADATKQKLALYSEEGALFPNHAAAKTDPFAASPRRRICRRARRPAKARGSWRPIACGKAAGR